MPRPTFKRPVPEMEPYPIRPGLRKLCDALEGWRDDAPESLPFCTTCRTTIHVGDRYVIAFPLTVLCIACSGMVVRERR